MTKAKVENSAYSEGGQNRAEDPHFDSNDHAGE
jgi:hypothetical protein